MIKQELYDLIGLHNEVGKRERLLYPELYVFGKKLFDYRHPNPRYIRFPAYNEGDDKIYLGKETIEIHWEEYHCGDTDYNELCLPTEYLFMADEGWKAIEVKEEEERKRKAKIEQKKKEEEMKKHQKDLDEKEFQRLLIKLGKK